MKKLVGVLPRKTAKLLEKMKTKKWLSNFYLAGGTALALQYGHRQSVDLDFFTGKNFTKANLLREISAVGNFRILNEDENTLEGVLEGVKVSFMMYPYPLLNKLIFYDTNVSLADETDIAIMKIGAIAGRNTKKDFIDLFFYLNRNKMTIRNLLRLADEKFKPAQYDPYHVYKSLVYFREAEKDPMPFMIVDVKWKDVKKFFEKQIKTF